MNTIPENKKEYGFVHLGGGFNAPFWIDGENFVVQLELNDGRCLTVVTVKDMVKYTEGHCMDIEITCTILHQLLKEFTKLTQK